MDMLWDDIWVNGKVFTCESEDSILNNAAIAIKDKKIAWVGFMDKLLDDPSQLAKNVHNIEGLCVTPGLIDCHTHIVYAGNRSDEFEKNIQGIAYKDIANSGGGIQSTVAATRAASEKDLFTQSLLRAKALQQSGVTTIEIKSGYGLDWQNEKKILKIAKNIGSLLPLTVKRTFLGAHTTPPEYKNKSIEYIDLVCNQMIPDLVKENLADAVDVFCENIAFDLSQTEKVFKTAHKYKLDIKCHSEQLSCLDSTIVAANYNAISVDHLEYASLDGLKAIARSNTIAVLLPAAFYFLQEKQLPPIKLLRELNIPIAIATDCNPGTSPVVSILIVMNMACVLFRLSPAEVLQGVTLNAAKSLGLGSSHGSISVGKHADLAIWSVKSPADLCYHLGENSLVYLVKDGEIIIQNS